MASNLYFEKKDKFRKESCCFIYLLDDLLQKKVSSNFQKIAVKLWPVGQFQGEDVERYIPDTISTVFVIEKEYAIDEYYKHDELSERNNEVQYYCEVNIAQSMCSEKGTMKCINLYSTLQRSERKNEALTVENVTYFTVPFTVPFTSL